MTDRFPHLRDTPFPNFSTVDPYRRKVDFDYGRYDYEASIKLCNVPWPFDYRHAVNWQSEEQRDAYLDGIDGRTVELSQGFARTQLDRVAVNVPYDVALTYNYVYMKVPPLTQDELIEHETQAGIRTVCAFISECIYQAPSTTMLVLDVDVWTTYLPHLSTSAVMLERGHAPMYKTSASEYLTDPVNKCSDLLTPDVDYAGSDIVRGGEFEPLSTAQLVYVIASPIPHDQLLSITQATSQSDTPATYYDLTSRNGYQVGVSGYTWPSDGKSYAGMTIPASVTRAEGSAPTGLYYYGIYAANVNHGALETIASLLPVFITSAVAAYVVPANLIGISEQYIVGGFSIYKVTSEYRLQGGPTFTLSKSMFGYPERYANIAKLYTFPYAHLQISDDLGNEIALHVEDCHGTIESMQALSVIWPTLAWEVALTNVASVAGDVTYSWRKLTAGAESHTLPGADFMRFLLSYDVPTYALRLTAKREAALCGYADAQARRESAIVSYQSAMRSANTGLENALASNATAKTNSDASADTAKSNADENADTAKTNTDRSADTTKANTTLSTNNARTNASVQNRFRDDAEYNARIYTTDTASTDITYVYQSTVTSQHQQEFAAMAGIVNNVSSGMGNAVLDIATGDFKGAAVNAVGGISGALNAGASYLVSASTDVTLSGLAQQEIYDKAAVAAALGYVNRGNANAENTELTENSADTADAIATSTQTTTKANALATQTTTKANALATQTTAKANSTRAKATGDANATYSRGTTEENAKAALTLAKVVYEASLANAALQPPVTHGDYSGDMRADTFQRRGLHLRAITQSDGALSRTADAFLRYGYQYSGIWEIASWCPAGHDFCYWQASDLWQNMRDIANPTAERVYESILTMGVTVWNDPEKIGRVRI